MNVKYEEYEDTAEVFCSIVEDDLLISSRTRDLLTTFANWEWRVSVEVNPHSYEWQSYPSILHLTTGDSCSRLCAKVGDRIPAPNEGVLVSTALNGKPSFSI